jgi:hypothetical protein
MHFCPPLGEVAVRPEEDSCNEVSVDTQNPKKKPSSQSAKRGDKVLVRETTKE